MALSSLLITHVTLPKNNCNNTPHFRTITHSSFTNLNMTPSPTLFPRSASGWRRFPLSSRSSNNAEEEGMAEDLRVPEQWLDPLKAAEESEWLRVTLHKWLDDEYCPEPTNVDISNTAAQSYYKSLLEKETELGEILLKMVQDLESISYQESFHGAFSSANAAINLIIQKIEQVY